MDERQFELAAIAEEAERQRGIERRERYVGESALECVDCGVEIPEGRRKAVPGCQLCADCKQLGEDRRG